MGNIEEELIDNDESLIENKIYDWLARQSWIENYKIGSLMAETNAIFDEESHEDITLTKISEAEYSFTASVILSGSPRKDDVIFFGDTIYVTVKGFALWDALFQEWEIKDEYEISAKLVDLDEYSPEYHISEFRIFEKRIDDADKLLAAISEMSPRFWYRGHADESWELKTSLARHKNPSERLESNLRRGFEKRATLLQPDISKEIDKCTFLMQHHGLPTRLLDWTTSPLAALYFAVCDKKNDKNGCIWGLDPQALNSYHNAEKLNESDGLNEQLYKEYSNKTIAIHAPYVDERMQAQRSEFTLHGNYEALEKTSGYSAFLEKKLVISGSIKANMRRKLTNMGIDRSLFFPDLDNIARSVLDNSKEIEKNREDEKNTLF